MNAPMWAWQAREVAENARKPKRAIFASPRLGKTRACIESMLVAGPFRRGLVCAPLIVCPMWASLLEAARMSVMRAFAMSSREIEQAIAFDEPDVIMILNYDKVPLVADTLMEWRPVALVADESHYLKAHDSKRGKAVRRLAWQAKWVRLLTGTPTPNHYGDLWGQMVCLDQRSIAMGGWGSWTAFKAQHLVMDPVFPSTVRGHVNIAQLQERLTRDASFVRREDIFGADQFQEIVRDVTLPEKAERMYRKLAREWILEASDDMDDIRADHILKRLIRLQQLAAGFIPDEAGAIHHVHSAKLDAVRADLGEIIEAGEKVVIFHQFRWESDAYLALAREMIGEAAPGRVGRINGDTPSASREAVVEAFNTIEGPAIIVVQTASGGIGISLREADHAFFTTQSFSFAKEDQARDRIYAQDARGVKARCVTYYVAENTVDDYIREVIRTKTNIHESVRLADRETMAFGRIARPRKKIA